MAFINELWPCSVAITRFAYPHFIVRLFYSDMIRVEAIAYVMLNKELVDQTYRRYTLSYNCYSICKIIKSDDTK